MKKLLIFIFLFSGLASFGQIQFFMINKSTTPPPEAGTIIRTQAESYDYQNDIIPLTTTDVDGAYEVAYTNTGDYALYTINLAASGNHTMSFRFALYEGDITLTIKSADGTTTYGTAPLTGVYGTWTKQDFTINFPTSGNQQIRVVFDHGVSINWFEIDNSFTPLYNTEFYMNFHGIYTGSPGFPGGATTWNDMKPANDTENDIKTAGGYVKSSLQDSRFVTYAVTFTNTSAALGTMSSPTAATEGDGVFSNAVIGYGWRFPDNSTITIGGLTATKTYTFYFHANSQNWEGGNAVTWTIGSTTTPSVNTHTNIGSHASYPDWKTDPAIRKITGVTGVTSVAIVMHSDGDVPLVAMIIEENNVARRSLR